MRKRRIDLPATLRRSPPKAQRTYAKTLLAAETSYGPGERAHRTALSSLKHSFEKVGDHWEAKRVRGPSDAQAARSGKAARDSRQPTAGGIDASGRSRAALYERARQLGIAGRSGMDKEALARAIARRTRSG
jgi:hypothetical protein